MSLYNLLHGHDSNAGPILHALGIDPAQVDRFRDASFGKDGDLRVFHLLCRTGGGNRTYAHYYFRIPEAVVAELLAQGLSLDDVTATATLEEKTEAAVAAIKAFP